MMMESKQHLQQQEQDPNAGVILADASTTASSSHDPSLLPPRGLSPTQREPSASHIIVKGPSTSKPSSTVDLSMPTLGGVPPPTTLTSSTSLSLSSSDKQQQPRIRRPFGSRGRAISSSSTGKNHRRAAGLSQKNNNHRSLSPMRKTTSGGRAHVASSMTTHRATRRTTSHQSPKERYQQIQRMSQPQHNLTNNNNNGVADNSPIPISLSMSMSSSQDSAENTTIKNASAVEEGTSRPVIRTSSAPTSSAAAAANKSDTYIVGANHNSTKDAKVGRSKSSANSPKRSFSGAAAIKKMRSKAKKKISRLKSGGAVPRKQEPTQRAVDTSPSRSTGSVGDTAGTTDNNLSHDNKLSSSSTKSIPEASSSNSAKLEATTPTAGTQFSSPGGAEEAGSNNPNDSESGDATNDDSEVSPTAPGKFGKIKVKAKKKISRLKSGGAVPRKKEPNVRATVEEDYGDISTSITEGDPLILAATQLGSQTTTTTASTTSGGLQQDAKSAFLSKKERMNASFNGSFNSSIGCFNGNASLGSIPGAHSVNGGSAAESQKGLRRSNSGSNHSPLQSSSTKNQQYRKVSSHGSSTTTNKGSKTGSSISGEETLLPGAESVTRSLRNERRREKFDIPDSSHNEEDDNGLMVPPRSSMDEVARMALDMLLEERNEAYEQKFNAVYPSLEAVDETNNGGGPSPAQAQDTIDLAFAPTALTQQPPSNAITAVVVPATEDDTDPLHDTVLQAGGQFPSVMENKQLPKLGKRAKWLTVGALLVVILGIIVAVVAVTQSGGSDDSSNQTDAADDAVVSIGTPEATRPPNVDIRDYLVSTLLPTHLAAVLSHDEVNNPQILAMEWLLDDPLVEQYSNTRLLQRYALATFFFSTDGTSWSYQGNFLSYDHHECQWTDNEGSSCDESGLSNSDFSSGTIKRLDQLDNNLQGFLPAEMSLLSSLEELLFSRNELEGTIPWTIGFLTNLEAIIVDDNQLTGELPSEIGLLTNLVDLSAKENNLSSQIPTELGNLAQLKSLQLSKNQLSQRIPSQLGGMVQLQRLYLDENQLDQSIPTELFSLTNLKDLFLDMNQLTGSLSSLIGQLGELNRLMLHDNIFSGPIPSEVGLLSKLVIWSSEVNGFKGKLPSELGVMGTSSLQTLSIHSNWLTGPIPTTLSGLTALRELKLEINSLTSTIPLDLPLKLRELALEENELTGTIHTELGLLSDLVELWLFKNNLSGTVPSELGQLAQINHIILDNNDLTGSLPATLGQLQPTLTIFNISQTAITGVFPEELCDVRQVHFDCSDSLCGCGDRCSCSAA